MTQLQTKTIPVTTKNQWFQRAEVIQRNRKKRWQHRQFLVEGVRAINQLRRSPQWQTEALIYSPAERLSGWAQDVLQEIACPYHLEFSRELLAELSAKEETSEVLALVNMPVIDDIPVELTEKSVVVLLDRPSSPGNLGSIIRSCDAFGVDRLVLTGHGVDPFDPVTVRATAGAFFHVPLARLSGTETLATWFAASRQARPTLQIIGTSAKGDLPLTACDFTGPTILCLGNETMGLSAWLKEQCDTLAYMHMQGVASSLNLACATTAILFEVCRQRGKV
ncbi:MAG: TrmH family RNA methyltransferase [Caldilineaceae bacterium]